MKRGLLTLFAATFALLGLTTPGRAQGEMGNIKGTVSDDQGQPIEGAILKLHNSGKGGDFTTKTDKKGLYYKRSLPSGNYDFTLEKEGYKSVSDHFRVAAGGDHKYDFTLAKGAPEGAKEFAKGFDAFNKGDFAGAITEFEAALVKAPNLVEIRVNLALAYLRAGKKPEAVAQLEKAVSMAPNEPRVMFQLGGAYVEMKDWDKARDSFEKGLALQPDLKDPLAYEATITLGAVCFAKGDVDKSIGYFEKALAAKSGPIPMLGLGKGYLSKGDNAKALQLFEQVVATAPESPEAAQAKAFIGSLKKPGEI